MNYTVTEKEILAIIDSLRHFTPQLTATKFTILTDNKATVAFLKTTDVTSPNERWLTFLLGFDFEIQYLEGKRNILADVISRSFKKPTKLSRIVQKIHHLQC